VPVTGVFETDEMGRGAAAVAAGFGIGILPLYAARDGLQRGQLVPLLPRFQVVPESAIYLVYLPNRTLSSRVRADRFSRAAVRACPFMGSGLVRHASSFDLQPL